jgi:hypothetical protein
MNETEFLVSGDATLLTFRRAARNRVIGFDWILDGFNRTQPERPLWARKLE